jgi:hypothetical protein
MTQISVPEVSQISENVNGITTWKIGEGVTMEENT